jgi:hypothetical protein
MVTSPLAFAPRVRRAMINTIMNNPQNILCDGALAQQLKQELIWQGKPVRLVENVGPNDPRRYPFGDFVLEMELADATLFKLRHGDRVTLIP